MKLTIPSDCGFALAALIIFMTALSILLAAAVPVYRVQVQRELEEELIFRGQEYVRAIQKYQRQFGIYPPSLEALVETNGIRYLRRPYVDPITGESFRLLTVNPDGTINGSTLSQAGANSDLFQGGMPQIFGQTGSAQNRGNGQAEGRGLGAPAAGNVSSGGLGSGPEPGFGASGIGQPNFGQASAPIAPSPQAPVGFGAPPIAGAGGLGGPIPGQGIGAPQPAAGGGRPGPQELAPAAAGASQPFAAGAIVGVAPRNEQPSLKVYNQRDTYSEWEFVAIPGFGTIAASTPVPSQVPGQPIEFQGDQPFPTSGGQPNPFN